MPASALIHRYTLLQFEEAEEFLPYLGMAEQQVADLEVATAGVPVWD